MCHSGKDLPPPSHSTLSVLTPHVIPASMPIVGAFALVVMGSTIWVVYIYATGPSRHLGYKLLCPLPNVFVEVSSRSYPPASLDESDRVLELYGTCMLVG